MPVEFICDGCGRRASGNANSLGRWFKPSSWYQRTTPEHGTQVACSEECTKKLGGAIAPW